MLEEGLQSAEFDKDGEETNSTIVVRIYRVVQKSDNPVLILR